MGTFLIAAVAIIVGAAWTYATDGVTKTPVCVESSKIVENISVDPEQTRYTVKLENGEFRQVFANVLRGSGSVCVKEQ